MFVTAYVAAFFTLNIKQLLLTIQHTPVLSVACSSSTMTPLKGCP